MTQAEGLTTNLDTKETENFHLQMENRELRDRIEILESVIATSNFQTADLDALDWREVFHEELHKKAPQVKTNNESINRLIAELFESKKVQARHGEEMSAVMSENNELKMQIERYKQNIQ